ncbi:Small RNA 2'-O-methyltransferase, partial [Mucuna pruriens]
MKEDGSQECIHVASLYIPSSVENSIEAHSFICDSATLISLQIYLNLDNVFSDTTLCSLLLQNHNYWIHIINCQMQKNPFILRDLLVKCKSLLVCAIISDAILACIGYTWKSIDLFLLGCQYWMRLGKTPGCIYKLSTEVILASELPSRFTARANWRGSLPTYFVCFATSNVCLNLSSPLHFILSKYHLDYQDHNLVRMCQLGLCNIHSIQIQSCLRGRMMLFRMLH